MDISKLKQMFGGRKSRAGLANMIFAVVVGILATKGLLTEAMAMFIIGSGAVGAGMNIWGIATEDSAKARSPFEIKCPEGDD